MASIEYDFRTPSRTVVAPDDPGPEWVTLGNGLLMIRMQTAEEASALCRRITTALSHCDEDGVPLPGSTRAHFWSGLLIGVICGGAFALAVSTFLEVLP